MIHRDFWRTGRWHALQPGDPGSSFWITEGPSVQSVGQTGVTVQWQTSQKSTAYLDFAYNPADVGTANGWTGSQYDDTLTTEYHVISEGGLSVATTYYYQVRSTDANDDTITSPVLSFTTQGTQPPPTPSDEIGPRYDLYGAGASGNFPAFPTGGTVVVVPTSILASSTPARALSDWLYQQDNGSVIVFDSSGGGTAYGAGTEYIFEEPVRIHGRQEQRTLTLWGYNSRLKWPSESTANSFGDWLPGCLVFKYGGFLDSAVLGFEIEGGNDEGGTWYCRNHSGFNEEHNAIYHFGAYYNFDVFDNHIHHVSNTIFMANWNIYQYWSNPNWAHGFYSKDVEVAYNRLEKTGTQNVNFKYSFGSYLHHNFIDYTGLISINFELGLKADGPSPYPSGYRWHRDVTVQNNRVMWCGCHLSPDPRGTPGGFPVMMGGMFSDWLDVYQDYLENWTITDNEFVGGRFGYGNPSAQIEMYGFVDEDLAESTHHGHSTGECATKRNLVWKRNIGRIEQDQVMNGYGFWADSWQGVDIQDNDFQGAPLVLTDCSNITLANNGGVDVYYAFPGPIRR